MSDDPLRNLAGLRILIVEDERLIALDVQDVVEGWGCTVIGPVATAPAALDLIAQDLPDCAILDVQLKEGTSEPVATALREALRPFLVMSAYQRGHLTGSLRDAPLMSKPVDDKILRQELSALLDAISFR